MLSIVAGVAFAQPGTALKQDVIRAEPFRDAKTVGTLSRGDQVEIAKKESGWLLVNSGKGRGWVRMLSIKTGSARKAAGGSGVSELLGLASGRAGTGRVVATTGVRGLGEEQLKAAKFDDKELKLLESYTVSRQQAGQFARQGKLIPRQVEYLPAPDEAGGGAE